MLDADECIRGVLIPAGDGLAGPFDIFLKGSRIAAIEPAQGSDSNNICLPGFVDAHCHGAAAVFDPAIQLALLRQGVTTIVVGQDGIGYAPSNKDSFDWSGNYFAGIDGTTPFVQPGSMASWLASYDKTTALNVAAFVPHGSLRYLVMQASQRNAAPQEIAEMAEILGQSLAEGALGLATGLEYVPAAWAQKDELVTLLEIVTQHNRVHSSHMRGYESAAPGAVAELIDLAQASGGAKTHIAHFHGESKLLSALLDKASDAGVPMTFDSYPYLRGCSLLAMVSLPTWLPLADPIATLDLIANDEETKTKLLGHLATLDDLWPRTTLGWADGYDWVAGLTIPEIAAKMGVTPAQAALELLVGTKLKASCVFEQPPTNSQASVMALADRPEHIAGSDAIYVPFEAAGRPHPRGWGALVRWLKLKVAPWEAAQQEQTEAGWTWAEAVEHLSTRAVRRFGLGQRGKIEVGAIADLVVVNPARLADTATYEHPRSLATGIDDVWVAGRQVLKGGELTGETPGSGLRWEGNSR